MQMQIFMVLMEKLRKFFIEYISYILYFMNSNYLIEIFLQRAGLQVSADENMVARPLDCVDGAGVDREFTENFEKFVRQHGNRDHRK